MALPSAWCAPPNLSLWALRGQGGWLRRLEPSAELPSPASHNAAVFISRLQYNNYNTLFPLSVLCSCDQYAVKSCRNQRERHSERQQSGSCHLLQWEAEFILPWQITISQLRLDTHNDTCVITVCREVRMTIKEGYYRVELINAVWEIPQRYQGLMPVGTGAFGMVCSATDTERLSSEGVAVRVAIKKIARPFQSQIHAKRTYRELKMLKHMKHENVSEYCGWWIWEIFKTSIFNRLLSC